MPRSHDGDDAALLGDFQLNLKLLIAPYKTFAKQQGQTTLPSHGADIGSGPAVRVLTSNDATSVRRIEAISEPPSASFQRPRLEAAEMAIDAFVELLGPVVEQCERQQRDRLRRASPHQGVGLCEVGPNGDDEDDGIAAFVMIGDRYNEPLGSLQLAFHDSGRQLHPDACTTAIRERNNFLAAAASLTRSLHAQALERLSQVPHLFAALNASREVQGGIRDNRLGVVYDRHAQNALYDGQRRLKRDLLRRGISHVGFRFMRVPVAFIAPWPPPEHRLRPARAPSSNGSSGLLLDSSFLLSTSDDQSLTADRKLKSCFLLVIGKVLMPPQLSGGTNDAAATLGRHRALAVADIGHAKRLPQRFDSPTAIRPREAQEERNRRIIRERSDKRRLAAATDPDQPQRKADAVDDLAASAVRNCTDAHVVRMALGQRNDRVIKLVTSVFDSEMQASAKRFPPPSDATVPHFTRYRDMLVQVKAVALYAEASATEGCGANAIARAALGAAEPGGRTTNGGGGGSPSPPKEHGLPMKFTKDWSCPIASLYSSKSRVLAMDPRVLALRQFPSVDDGDAVAPLMSIAAVLRRGWISWDVLGNEPTLAMTLSRHLHSRHGVAVAAARIDSYSVAPGEIQSDEPLAFRHSVTFGSAGS